MKQQTSFLIETLSSWQLVGQKKTIGQPEPGEEGLAGREEHGSGERIAMGWGNGDRDLEALYDLELIMDGNIDRVLTSSSLNLSGQSLATTDGVAATTEQGGVSVAAAICTGPQEHFPRTASISLALGSLMASSKLAFKPAPPVSASVPRLAGAAVPASLPSQKRCVAPVAVAPSSQLGVAVDAAAAPGASSRVAAGCTTAFPDYLRLRDSGRAFGNPGSGAALRRASIVWFRNDLRVHDNETLTSASQDSLSIVPVYCFDPRDYGKSTSGFDKTGPYRARFLLECVSNLRESLRERGSELVVRVGKPEEELPKLARDVGADALYAHQEVSYEELQAEDKVGAALKEEGVDVKFFWGSTLYHVDDLPFSLEQMPANYGGFRDQVQGVRVRPAIETPKQLKGLPALRGKLSEGDIPNLQQLGLAPAGPAKEDGHLAGGAAMVGGEAEALRKLTLFAEDMPRQVIASGSTSASASGTSDGSGSGIFGANFSCKISPWLAMGCLSPRRMFEDLKKDSHRTAQSRGQVRAETADTRLNWLLFELLWRDFFRFITRKYGSSKKSLQDSPCSASSTASPAPVAV